MKYFSTWQEAFQYFVSIYGQEYEDAYDIVSDFELHLRQNTKNTYYLHEGE